MNPFKKYTVILFSILSFVFVGSSFAKEIFVSNANVTAGDGSLLNPYNTIQQAADVAVSGDVITIRAGVYREEVKIVSDGVIYQSFPGEKVVLNGSEQLKEWILVPGSTTVYKAKMDFDAPGNEKSNYPTNQLFVDQKMIELARWPNQTSTNISIPNVAIADGVTASGLFGTITDAEFDEPDGRWVGSTIFINLSNGALDGVGYTIGIVTATNRAAKTITYKDATAPKMGHQPWMVGKGTEYYMFQPTKQGVESTGGVKDLLSPGEWWKDGDTVYVNMPNGLAPNEIGLGTNIVEAKKREFAFRPASDTENRSNYTIKNIDLFGCTITTNTRFRKNYKSIIEDANNITLDGINAKYLSHFTETGGIGNENTYGRSGLIVSGRNCLIKNCNIEFSAGQGISLLGEGNRAFNNVITSVNYMLSNAGAFCTGNICVDCEVGYNTISNTGHIGINFAGLKNSDAKKRGVARIHHNKLFDFLLRSNDSGGINDVGSFGNWARVDHNVLYKTFNTTRSEQDVYGIYFDYNEGSYLVDHNLVYSMKQAVLINRSKNISIYNNTLLTNQYSEQAIVDATGGDGTSDTIRNNILSGAANTPCCRFPNLRKAVTSNNIVNAFGTVRQNEIFVNPSTGNFQLNNTATDAIDKGLNNYQFNDAIVGPNVDLGAFEYGVALWEAGPTSILPPTITPGSGEFIDQSSITFKTEATGSNVTIRYTLNGAEPNISSPLYTNQPVIVTDTTWVKARVFIDDLPVSEISSSNIFVTKIANIPPISVGISRLSGTYPVRVYVTLFSPNSEVREIRYTLDGSEPNLASEVYTGAQLLITQSVTLKAIAIGKYIVSPIKTEVYTITGPTVAINMNGGNLTQPTKITLTATPFGGSKIYYTLDGTDPTELSTLYQSSITLSSATTLKYLAINNGLVGEVKTAVFTANNIQDVTFSPNGGNFNDALAVTLHTSTSGASIYYTKDGSTPTINSILYNGQAIAIPTSLTIKAFVILNGVFGNVTSATFTIASPEVTISPNGADSSREIIVNLSSSLNGAIIYYTIDGSTPTITSLVYTNPIVVKKTLTIKAIAIKGFLVSEIKEANFTITLGEAKVVVFPNPTSEGKFYINFNRPQKGHVIRVSVYDVLGRLLFKKSVTMVDSVLQEEEFNVPHLKTGTYIIKMKTVSAHLTDLLDEEIKLVVK